MMVEELRRELADSGVDYEVIAHRPTMTAADEARAIEVAPEEVAKTLVLTSDAGYVRAVVPASERLDLHKVRAVLGNGKSTRLATEAELVAAYPMFELGAVPPFGGPDGDRTIVDRRLAERESVVVEAGSHRESLRVKTQDLLAITHAEIAEISAD
jgi:Ala-tRNA(Pro) deacylase